MRLLAGVGVHVGVVVVVVNVVVAVGLQEQAELYREGLLPQPPVARAGKPVVAVFMMVVYVAQNAEAAERAEGLALGNRALRQLENHFSASDLMC